MIRVIIFLIATLVLYGFMGYRTYLSYIYKDDIIFIARDLKDRQDQIGQLNDAIQYIYENDIVSLRDANAYLIKYAKPKSVDKAIKATPLPKLVML
jgi:hypothetical protein